MEIFNHINFIENNFNIELGDFQKRFIKTFQETDKDIIIKKHRQYSGLSTVVSALIASIFLNEKGKTIGIYCKNLNCGELYLNKVKQFCENNEINTIKKLEINGNYLKIITKFNDARGMSLDYLFYSEMDFLSVNESSLMCGVGTNHTRIIIYSSLNKNNNHSLFQHLFNNENKNVIKLDTGKPKLDKDTLFTLYNSLSPEDFCIEYLNILPKENN